MYSLDCSYYKAEFKTLNQLIDDVLMTGMDPNYEVTIDGVGTGEILFDLIQI